MIEVKGKTYTVDKSSLIGSDYHIITHAHRDHLPGEICGKVIASKETVKLAEKRGLRIKDFKEEDRGVELIDSGHILGSRAALIDDEVLLTGDVCLRDRFFMKGFKPPKAKILVMEATYGRKEYVFEETGRIIEESLNEVSKAISSGKSVILTGYALGKSQILTKLFSWCENLIVSREVEKFNRIYEGFGIDLGNYLSYEEAKREGILSRKSWVMVAPNRAFIKRLAEKRDALIFSFTGWAADKSFMYWSEVDKSFPLSDHCDFRDLLRIVEKVRPEKVYVSYGFADEFSKFLKERGFDSVPLRPNQKIIEDF